MSICRFSPYSDVYAYESDRGFVVHVAYYTLTSKEEPPKLQDYDVDSLVAYSKRLREWIERAERIPIEKPYAGDTLYFDDFDECLKFLLELKRLGYKVPDSVFEE